MKSTNQPRAAEDVGSVRAYVENDELVIRLPLLAFGGRKPSAGRVIVATSRGTRRVTGDLGGRKILFTALAYEEEPTARPQYASIF
jgi:hypothetical protein